ncbi:YraN family protein [Adlercreutzia sp. ZJ473]|uniref:YraN family protein n=1 Tax=Adlercreutzia sp. ZJ473 TaxID=2722822 RepID=UPI0015582135|nr:YraN family protein [Adlercreutzia sp. ZJ473]
MTTSILSDRINAAAIRFLERQGYKIIDPAWDIAEGQTGIVADDKGTLVFVETAASQAGSDMPAEDESDESRRASEGAVARWLATPQAAEFEDIPIRFDVIRVLVIGADRALLRHHIGRFGIAAC